MAKDKLERLLKKENLTEQEACKIIKSAKGGKPRGYTKLPISGHSFFYGVISDAHIGHKEFLEELFDKAVRVFKKEGVDFVLDGGDHFESMSGRPGHIYELSHLGFSQQMTYATQLYSQFTTPIYGIDGNHDEWYLRKSDIGLIVGEELERRVKNYHHLGIMEGNLLVRNIHIQLFHPNDGTAFTPGYKLQKYIDSLEGGRKPHIVHQGHYHKAHEMFYRNVFGFDNGTLCGQTLWMKGKKIQAHVGFWTVRVFYDKQGVDSVSARFYPYYER